MSRASSLPRILIAAITLALTIPSAVLAQAEGAGAKSQPCEDDSHSPGNSRRFWHQQNRPKWCRFMTIAPREVLEKKTLDAFRRLLDVLNPCRDAGGTFLIPLEREVSRPNQSGSMRIWMFGLRAGHLLIPVPPGMPTNSLARFALSDLPYTPSEWRNPKP